MGNNANSFVERSASPLRQNSFDLLMLLVTQESVHRVLHDLKNDARKPRNSADIDACFSSYEWLKEFYFSRVESFFDGQQKFGRYDDFLEVLLCTAPHIKNNGSKCAFVDPL